MCCGGLLTLCFCELSEFACCLLISFCFSGHRLLLWFTGDGELACKSWCAGRGVDL